MPDDSSDDQALDDFLKHTSHADSPENVGKSVEEGSGSRIVERLERRRRRYHWAVFGPMFLISGLFGVNFLWGAILAPGGGQGGFVSLSLGLVTLAIGFLAYTKYKQDMEE